MINEQEFYDNFRSEFIDADEITIDAETDFRKLDSWDSLTGMAVLVMIQDKYTDKFTEKEFKECKVSGDVFNCVNNLMS